MGPSDHLPDSNPSQPEPQSAEAILRVLGHDLDTLRHQVSGYLSEDIAHLQAKKQRLMADIEALEGDFESLQAQHQQLQTSYAEGLSQQQIAQQQAWAKRLAIALATHLQGRLETALTTARPNALQAAPSEVAISPLANASQGLAALDATLQNTLASLQHDLTSYQSSISQQLNRMQSVEQQGEAILEALVARLSQQLQSQMVSPSGTTAPARNGHSALPPPPVGEPLAGPALPPSPYRGPQPPGYPGSEPPPPPLPPASHSQASLLRPPLTTAESTPTENSRRPSPTDLQLGLMMVVFSTLALSLHNVIVGVIGYGGQLLGQISVAEVLPLTIPNSLLLLWLRMVVVVPLLALVAPRLYPNVGNDLRQIFRSDQRRPLAQVIASGSFLFLSQVLIYKAIADVGPGVAVTLLFMYPLITVPLAWFLFGDRPTPLRLVVMFAISMGIVFTTLPRIYTDLGDGVSLWGVGAALLASVAFSLFLVAMQLCFKRLHPVSVSLLQFSTIFILTSLILIVGSFFGLDPGEPTRPLGLYVGAGLLGLLTLLGYLFNNYGVKLLGASQASIVAASGPVVTAILAYLITPGEKSALLFIQWMGVILVTLGVISLSLERLASQRRQAKRRSAVPPNTGQWP
ncbi:EamA family transporter [Leptolyngbya sp. CCNP1308]|uniref:DMT family transporter n=1 Tax=Leptolyngbya sp. CCNP1308 TaxID=3110255 RepID=UPI002B1F982F|nr:EamA family transporter [Leptolyngbya sp. CCNP1308]MEA5452731.1 EamA family transporter [Leptolyngbya sp. CCNP1308]